MIRSRQCTRLTANRSQSGVLNRLRQELRAFVDMGSAQSKEADQVIQSPTTVLYILDGVYNRVLRDGNVGRLYSDVQNGITR